MGSQNNNKEQMRRVRVIQNNSGLAAEQIPAVKFRPITVEEKLPQKFGIEDSQEESKAPQWKDIVSSHSQEEAAEFELLWDDFKRSMGDVKQEGAPTKVVTEDDFSPRVFQIELFAQVRKWEAEKEEKQLEGIIKKLNFYFSKPNSPNDNIRNTCNELVHCLIKAGNLPAVKQMLKLTKMDVEQTDNAGNTLLISAAKYGHCETVIYLLTQGAQIDACNKRHESALTYAVEQENLPMIELLLNADADMRQPTLARTILHEAVETKKNQALSCLLGYLKQMNKEEARQMINERDFNSHTALFLAVINGDLNAVRELLKAGADPNIPNKYGQTPLHFAASNRDAPVVLALVRAKADPKISFQGKQPIDTNPGFAIQSILKGAIERLKTGEAKKSSFPRFSYEAPELSQNLYSPPKNTIAKSHSCSG